MNTNRHPADARHARRGAPHRGLRHQQQPPEHGLLISGPAIRAAAPPWPVQNQGLAQRIARLGLPSGGSEKFHIHAQLSIYNQGLYVTVPTNIGINPRHHVESSLHTHDPTGIIHMEAPAPFRFTLGIFFAEWGVRFGAGTLGSLHDNGPRPRVGVRQRQPRQQPRAPRARQQRRHLDRL